MLDRDKLLEELKIHLYKAHQQMKLAADKHRRKVEFATGDWVYVKRKPYRRKSLVTRSNEKLAPRYYRPFKVTDRVGKMTYRPALLETMQVHPVFHVS